MKSPRTSETNDDLTANCVILLFPRDPFDLSISSLGIYVLSAFAEIVYRISFCVGGISIAVTFLNMSQTSLRSSMSRWPSKAITDHFPIEIAGFNIFLIFGLLGFNE